MRLAQVSDTHFGTEQPPVVAGLRAALARRPPDVVVLCGDVTQRARRTQFAAAARFMDALPASAERIAIPGNHDLPLFNLWARFRAPYAGWQRTFGSRETLWHRDGVAVLALDATSPWRHKDGALGASHLRRRLAAARAACGPEGLLVVAAHQPLWTAWGEDKRQTLHRRQETARVLAEARADVVLSGHVHVPIIATSAVSDPQLSWRFVLSGSGTAVSHRTRPGAPNSFNSLELARGMPLRVTRWDWDGATFALREEKIFRRGADGWEERPAVAA